MLAEQLAEAQSRAAEEERLKEEELARLAQSRKSETEVMSARERYLQRKKEAASSKN